MVSAIRISLVASFSSLIFSPAIAINTYNGQASVDISTHSELQGQR
jgi:hypothetical protein